MSIKDVKLRKGKNRHEVNELIGEWLTLEDDIYLGNAYKHKWRCKCGNIIESKTWSKIRGHRSIKCSRCKYNEIEEKYKYEVEKTDEYEYIRSYRAGDRLSNGKLVDDSPYIQVKHKYCGCVYEVVASGFINDNKRCSHCCGSYENSFAHHIEIELGEPLEKYWDFEKNTVNPYHISKNSHALGWIKCTEKDYHGSFKILLKNFIRALRNDNPGCPYCHGKKIHPKDSFAQYHIDNTDKDFLTKYWSDKNTVNPWSIAPYSNNYKVWIKCQEKDYHDDHEVRCADFTEGVRCIYCSCRNNNVHIFDSFGYNNFLLSQSWSLNNEISPFRVSKSSGRKFEFICPECGNVWSATPASISRGSWCPQCSSSKGEKKINNWLRINNINFIPQKTFDNLLGLGGGNLLYDFYLPEYNLLIEYQGEYHDGSVSHQTEEDFNKQQEHDIRKRKYAKDNNINLLEIWYWDFDNIEEILKNELNI